MPIASLTALGSSSGNVAGAVAAIVDYLEGRQTITASIDVPSLDEHNLVAYYADTKTSDSLGWWSGRGIDATQLTGPVEPAVLAQVLLGRHPLTGEQLVAATGSAGRATSQATDEHTYLTLRETAKRLGVSEQRVSQLAIEGQRRTERLARGEESSSASWLDGTKHNGKWRFERSEVERLEALRSPVAPTEPARPGRRDGLLSADEVAQILGVTPRWVRALAEAGVQRQRLLDAGEDVDHIRQWLPGDRSANQWFFDPADIDKASKTRSAPRVVVAYDFTLSVEKSISLAWVHADAEQRGVIEDALRHGVQAGVSHLEDHGLAVRRDRSAVGADGMWAASYLHLTNRNLEPQLHVHTVIVNVAADAATGETQTVDGRGLFREVTTAGYLAGPRSGRSSPSGSASSAIDRTRARWNSPVFPRQRSRQCQRGALKLWRLPTSSATRPLNPARSLRCPPEPRNSTQRTSTTSLSRGEPCSPNMASDETKPK